MSQYDRLKELFTRQPRSARDKERIRAEWRHLIATDRALSVQRVMIRPEDATLQDLFRLAQIWPRIFEGLQPLMSKEKLPSAHPVVGRPGLDAAVTAAILKEKRNAGSVDVLLLHHVEDRDAVVAIETSLQALGILGRPVSAGNGALPDSVFQASTRTAAAFVGPSGRVPWEEHVVEEFLRDFLRRRHTTAFSVLLPGCREAPVLPNFFAEAANVDLRSADGSPADRVVWGIFWAHFLRTVPDWVTWNRAPPTEGQCLETFDGFVERIDGDIAHATLKSVERGDTFHCEYPVHELAAKGIGERRPFKCVVRKVSSQDVRIELQAIPQKELSGDEVNAIWKDIDRALGIDESDDEQ